MRYVFVVLALVMAVIPAPRSAASNSADEQWYVKPKVRHMIEHIRDAGHRFITWAPAEGEPTPASRQQRVRFWL